MSPGILCSAALLAGSLAGEWPHWRGPSYDGSSPAVGLPVQWSTSENLAWTTELPGQSAATPIVWGDRIFLSSFDDAGGGTRALCLDRGTGAVVWSHAVAAGNRPSSRSRGRENTHAACSPVTDGERVFFLYGTGDLVGFDFAGEQLWKRSVSGDGKIAIQWGYASSPLLWEGRLYVQVLQSGESFLLAIDPETGKDLWRHVRETEARAESREAYTTPVPFVNGERKEVLVLGGDCLTAHDAATGEELWRWCELNPTDAPNFRAISNTVVGKDGMVYVTMPRHNPLFALRVQGDDVEVAWSLRRPTGDTATPLIYDGLLYTLNGRQQELGAVRPETGELVWSGALETPSFIRASPTGADGKVYVIDAEGNVVVVKAGEEFEVLGRVAMDSYPCRATIVADEGQLLIRTGAALYCVGAPSDE
jgi:outer membrane protein assembly factor BamB